MNKIKTVFNKALTVIMTIVTITVAFAWVFTFFNITYGLAIWSNQWLMSLL